MLIVSIPYSSGLSFRSITFLNGRQIHLKSLNPLFIRSQFQILARESMSSTWLRSQSLIHQVSVSDNIEAGLGMGDRCESQSLIHQVSVSDFSDFLSAEALWESEVSIPYSSGLSFR